MSVPTGFCSKLHPGRWCRKTPPKAQKFDGEKLGDAIGRDRPAVGPPATENSEMGSLLSNTFLVVGGPLQGTAAGWSGHFSQNAIVIARNMSVWLLGTVLGGAGAELYLSSGTNHNNVPTLSLKTPQQALLQQAEVTTQDGGGDEDEAKGGKKKTQQRHSEKKI